MPKIRITYSGSIIVMVGNTDQRISVRSTQEVYDIAIVGGGFRATTFLSSSPSLLSKNIVILESSNVFGPGAFNHYLVTTSSNGSSMLKNIDYKGPFAKLKDNRTITSISGANHPVQAEKLSLALKEIGLAISNQLKGNVKLNTLVKKVELDGNTITLSLEDGEKVKVSHVILATGRRERKHRELEKWHSKVLLSSNAINNTRYEKLKSDILVMEGKSIVIAGCSHSAMTALQVLLKIFLELVANKPLFKRPKVFILQRSEVCLMYATKEEAMKEQIEGRERIFQGSEDICPDTGIVFRDSGLRHKSKELYCDVWAGNIENVSIIKINRLEDAAPLFDASGFIIQALGFKGEAPDIYESGKLIYSNHAGTPIWTDADGAAIINNQRYENISALRLEQTPEQFKDNGTYSKHLYKQLHQRLEEQFQKLEV